MTRHRPCRKRCRGSPSRAAVSFRWRLLLYREPGEDPDVKIVDRISSYIESTVHMVSTPIRLDSCNDSTNHPSGAIVSPRSVKQSAESWSALHDSAATQYTARVPNRVTAAPRPDHAAYAINNLTSASQKLSRPLVQDAPRQ